MLYKLLLRKKIRAGHISLTVLLAVYLAGWIAAPPVLYGQSDRTVERRYSFALIGVPLNEALQRLIDETHLDLVYETKRTTGKTASCRIERAAAEELLSCVLRGTGLDYIQLSSGTYVLVEDPQQPPAYGTVSGQVTDAETGEPLADANVLLTENGSGVSTNGAGRFALPQLKPGPHRLVVTHVAYRSAADTIRVSPNEGHSVEIALTPRVVLSPPVVISGFESRLPSKELGTGQRTASDRAAAPSGAGTEDVVRDLGAVVGVRLGDALSDVHLQGGGSGEQQFRLDGAPVFMPVPNGGFVGPFSPFAIEQVTVRKAGFGAGEGSHLAGVIDVKHQLSSSDDLAASGQVDPLSLNLRASGRAANGGRRLTWMAAGRTSLWPLYKPGRLETLFRSWGVPDDFLLEALRRSGDRPIGRKESARSGDDTRLALSGPLEMGYSDLHGAARMRFGDFRSVRVSAYRGTGTFGIEGTAPGRGAPPPLSSGQFEDGYHWSNQTGHFQYEWAAGSQLFLQGETWASSYHLNHSFESEVDTLGDGEERSAAAESETSNEFNRTGQIGLRVGWDYAHSERHLISGALSLISMASDFSLSLDPLGGGARYGPGHIQPVGWRLAGFLEDEINLGGGMQLMPGMRLTYLPGQQQVYVEPRLSLRYDRSLETGGSFAARTAVGLYRQYLTSFDVASRGAAALLPRLRFWLPVGRDMRPPEAYHAAGSVLYRPNGLWELRVESYFKHQPHLWAIGYGIRGEETPAAGFLARAAGCAYGIGTTVRRTGDRVQAEAQYEYAVARRRVAGRFGGRFLPVPWSAPHQLRLSVDAVLPHHLTVTLRWNGLFGRSWGFRQAYYDYLQPNPQTRRFPPYDLSNPADHRLPAFSQWDVGLAYTRDVGDFSLQGRITLLNVLGRRNVRDWSLFYDSIQERYVRSARRAVPFLPSVSLKIGW